MHQIPLGSFCFNAHFLSCIVLRSQTDDGARYVEDKNKKKEFIRKSLTLICSLNSNVSLLSIRRKSETAPCRFDGLPPSGQARENDHCGHRLLTKGNLPIVAK